MKFTSFWAVYLPIALAGFTGCAKKPHDEGRDVIETKIQPVVVSEIPRCLEEIRDAITLNQPEKIRSTISKTIQFQPSHLNQVFSDGETLLTYAVMMNATASRDLLLSLGADVNVPNANGETPLIVAAGIPKGPSVDKLILEHARLDDQDNKGNTALIWAIRNSEQEVARLLISSGANVEITNSDRRNALSYAHEKALVDVLDLLETRVQSNFSAAAPDASSFIKVLTNGDLRSLNRMIEDTKTIVKDYEDVNPLVLILQVSDFNTATEMAIKLIDSGAKINGPKNALTTPLIKSVEKQNMNFVKFFLNSSANVNLVDSEGKSALIYAIEKNNYDMVNILVRAYAEKKYSFIDKDGKKQSYSACSTAKETYNVLETPNDLVINEKIRNRLKCGSFLWF